MTEILILNVGSTNKGNRALVNSTIETIKKFDSKVEFVLSTVDDMSRYNLSGEGDFPVNPFISIYDKISSSKVYELMIK